METKEYHTIDKAEWERGCWDDEPDKKQWQHKETGLPCLIVRGPGGHLCGYVGISKEHPYYNVSSNGKRDEERNITGISPAHACDVHGGLNFADFCANTDDESIGICHTPCPGEPDNVWWLGFDCGHFGDVSPGELKRKGAFRDIGEMYRSLSYVEQEVESLAYQLKRVKGK